MIDPTGPRQRLPLWPVALFVVVVAASLAGFGNTLGGYFIADDFGYVGRFSSMSFSSWPHLFLREWSEGLWGDPLHELRPIAALSFIGDAHLWGRAAMGYRLTNLAVHAVCSWLVAIIAWRVSGEKFAAFVAGLLFALYPLHAAAIVWITGRVDLLATFFYLTAIAAWLSYRDSAKRRWLVVLWLSFPLAAFSKEFGVTLPLLVLAGDALMYRSRWKTETSRMLAPYAGLAIAALTYAACRRVAFGSDDESWLSMKGAVFFEALRERQLNYLRFLFSDFYFSPPVGPAMRPWSYALAILLLTGTAWLAWRARHRAASVLFGPVLYLVATIPLVVTYVSPRHLYLASAGLCVVWALGLAALPRRAGLLVASLLAASFAVALPAATRPWREAARLSGEMATSVRDVAANSPATAAIVIDAPVTVRGVYVWSWASPFALRPPFQNAAVLSERVVIEGPAVYRSEDRWADERPFEALAHAAGATVIDAGGGNHTIRSWWCPPVHLQPAAAQLAAHRALLDDAWADFMAKISQP